MIEIEDNERIIKVVHRHWFILLGHIFFLIFSFTMPVIFMMLLHFLPIESLLNFTGGIASAGSFFLFSWFLIVWMIGWKIWTSYYFDMVLITDKRVFDINQKGFFDRLSGSFRIDRIQNVSVEQKGIIQTMLDFGTIRFETAGGNDDDFVAPFIAHPYEIKKLINQMQDGTLDKTQEVHLHSDSLNRMAILTQSPSDMNSNSDFRGGKLDDSEGI